MLKIGIVGPETGGSGSVGQSQRRAVEMLAMKSTKKTWQVTGGWNATSRMTKEIHQVCKCHQQASSGDKSPRAYSAINSSCTLADIVHTQRAGIPRLLPDLQAQALQNRATNGFSELQSHDSLRASALKTYAAGNTRPQKGLAFTAADDYGQSGAKLLSLPLKKQDRNRGSRTYNGGDKDF